MNRKSFTLENTNNLYDNRQIKSMQCTATIDTDSLTVLIGHTITLTAKVDPPGIYNVNFNAFGSPINLAPIPTDIDGNATFPFDMTGVPVVYDLTVEVISPSVCTSSPLTIASVNNPCTGVTIDSISSNTITIGDIASITATATVSDQSIIEFVDSGSGKRFGSCTTSPSTGQCTVSIDTTGSPPGTYSVVAKVGNGPILEQCTSAPIDVTLQEAPGKIVVFSIPPGATILYDAIDIDLKSSAIISNITPGVDHTIELTLSGYTSYAYSHPINLSPGGTALIIAILSPLITPPLTGELHITSNPDGAEFGLYTGESDTTPATLTGLAALVDAYEAGASGYSSAIGSVDIKPGVVTNLHIALQPELAGSGLAIFESIPMEADIYIDDTLTGAKTSYATLLESGHHTYELRLSGYTSAKGDFVVVTGTENPAIISETLQSSGTGAILLLGGIAVGAILLGGSGSS